MNLYQYMHHLAASAAKGRPAAVGTPFRPCISAKTHQGGFIRGESDCWTRSSHCRSRSSWRFLFQDFTFLLQVFLGAGCTVRSDAPKVYVILSPIAFMTRNGLANSTAEPILWQTGFAGWVMRVTIYALGLLPSRATTFSCTYL